MEIIAADQGTQVAKVSGSYEFVFCSANSSHAAVSIDQSENAGFFGQRNVSLVSLSYLLSTQLKNALLRQDHNASGLNEVQSLTGIDLIF